jgi:hypothetical protein
MEAVRLVLRYAHLRTDVDKGHFLAIVGLTLANAAVAAFWH